MPAPPKIDTASVPDEVRKTMANSLLGAFLKQIQDPDTLQLYNELGRQFAERYERTYHRKP